jgi:phosphatidyl-myo-inositol dimannoside synthase
VTQGVEVLLVANNFPPVRGGSATVYASLARYCDGRVMVLAPRINYTDGLPLIGWREHDRCAPYPVLRLPLLRTRIGPPRRGGRKLLFLARDLAIRLRVAFSVLLVLVRKGACVVCIGELRASSWIIRLLSYVPRVRTLVYVHGDEITMDDPYDRQFTRRIRALLASDGIIVVSHFTERVVTGLLGEQAKSRIRLVENGVDTARFRPAARCPRLVKLYHLEGSFVFVSVCRLWEKKGIDHALRAFARLLPHHPNTRHLIVGTGPCEDALKSLARELEISEAVVFAGQVAEGDLADHYRLGDVFIMPNRELPNGDTEGFGLVFLEANGCGLPVIAGRDGGSRDAVQHEENGLVVNGHSVDEIFAAMMRLREDEAERARLRERGLAAAARADWKNKAEAFMQICTGDA